MRLSALGEIVAQEWKDTPEHRPYVQLESSVVMPNHVHLLFTILRDVDVRCRGVACNARHDQRLNGPPAESVGAIVRAFKGAVTRRARGELGLTGPVWQRNFYDRVIENDREFLDARDYVGRNPWRWMEDKLNPDWGSGRGGAARA